MIQANELRVGNILLSPDTNKWVIVELNHLKLIQNGVKFNDKYYEPIPLTPEILRKADVSNFPFELFYVGGRYHIALENGSWVFIESMHQLQNLYFALTGEELTINL